MFNWSPSFPAAAFATAGGWSLDAWPPRSMASGGESLFDASDGRGGRFGRRRRARLGFPRRFLELDANFLSRSPHYPGVALGSRHAHDECIRQNGGALNHEPGAPVGNIQNLAENRGREFSGVHPNVRIRLLTGCLPLFLDGPISGKAYAPGACHDNLRRSLGVSRVPKTCVETFAVLLIGFDNSMYG